MVAKAIMTVFFFCMPSMSSAAGESPFSISVHGNFTRMVRAGDVSGKIALSSIPFSTGTYGVGALAGVQGEILIWNGLVLITPGESFSGSTQPPRPDDQAALLITSQVKEWEKVQVPSNMTQREFERFVIDSARSRGVDTRKPFPFIVTGEIADYAWHVVTGATNRHGNGELHRQDHANNRIFSGSETRSKLVGFYSAEEFEGVISHPGERVHIHFADDNLKISGHLDTFDIRQGAILLLPMELQK